MFIEIIHDTFLYRCLSQVDRSQNILVVGTVFMNQCPILPFLLFLLEVSFHR